LSQLPKTKHAHFKSITDIQIPMSHAKHNGQISSNSKTANLVG